MTRNTLDVGPVKIGPGQPLAIIAGPCLAESLDIAMEIGQAVRDRCTQLGLTYIFKASYDKANRSSIDSPRGPGISAGRELLKQVRDKLGVPITSDLHEPSQAADSGKVIDLLQIPAFLCRQTDLLIAAAKTGRPINVKKGQFMAPIEMSNVIKKLQQAGAQPQHIMLTERGTFFGYHRLVNDFVGLGDLMELGPPVCFDVTHSTQQPGAEGSKSGGRPDRAAMLARCAVAAGVDALFIETRPDPTRGVSDASTMLPLAETLTLLEELANLRQATITHT